MASGGNDSNPWHNEHLHSTIPTHTQSSSTPNNSETEKCSPKWHTSPSPWSSNTSEKSPVKSLQDVMKEEQTVTVKHQENRKGFQSASSEAWYPGKVNRDKRRKDGPQISKPTSISGRPTFAKTTWTSSASNAEKLDIYTDYESLSKETGMRVHNVHKKDLMLSGYKGLVDWVKVPDHIYIGRDMTRYVPGAIGSKWHNPFKSGKGGNREQSCSQFKEYIRTNKKIYDNGKTLYQSLDELKGKTLGCWCHPERCHGHMLMELVSEVCL